MSFARIVPPASAMIARLQSITSCSRVADLQPAGDQAVTASAHERARRPLLGLRTRPGRVALAVMRMPQLLYHHGCGWMLDHTFLMIAHQGRRTGARRETVTMAAAYDPETLEVVVCSAWGNAEWIRNLRAHPALEIQIGRNSYAPEQRFLTEDDAVAVVLAFGRRHPHRLRLLAAILDWGDLDTEQAVREFVRRRPLVAFRPAHPPQADRE